MRDATTWSNVFPLPPGLERRADLPPTMLQTDPPNHGRLRGLVSQAFTPRMIARLEPRIVAIAEELVDGAVGAGRVDLVEALTYPLPVVVIAEIIGIPAEDREALERWSDALVADLGSGFVTPITAERLARHNALMDEMRTYFVPLVERRRVDPRDDLLSGLVAAELEGSRLTFDEMLQMLTLILVAGSESAPSTAEAIVRHTPPAMGRLTALLLFTLVVVRGAPLFASGFMLFEQNGRGVGSADAGEGAIAADASTVFWNPAGMTLLEGTNLASSGNLVQTHAKFTNEGSTINPSLGNTLLSGRNSSSDEIGLLSSFYLSQQVFDRWRVGLGVSTPFGLRTEWDAGWVGRYHALKSDLRTINVNPSLAVRVTDRLSIGGGADAMWARATLTNAVDLGSVCALFGGQAGLTPAGCRALGFRPQAIDGAVKVRGSDWAFGYNAGILFHPTSSTRIGLTYRSRIDENLAGNAYFTVPRKAKLLQATGALVNTPGRANLNLPDWTDLSAFHQITEHWAVLASIMWVHWARFDTLSIRFANPKQPTSVQPQNWDNTFRYSLGFQYTPVAHWIFRFGTALDETPVPSPAFRSARIPDSDRVWGSIGVGYVRDRMRVDFGYTHVFAVRGGVEHSDPNTGAVQRGHVDGGADVFGIQGSLGLF